MSLVFEVALDTYRERKNLVYALWVSGLPLLLHLFSGASVSQLSASASYLSSVLMFMFAYSGSRFMERSGWGMPYATALLIAFSAIGVKYGTQLIFGDNSLLVSVNAYGAALLTGLTAAVMAVLLFMDDPLKF